MTKVLTLEIPAKQFTTKAHFVLKDERFSWGRIRAAARKSMRGVGTESPYGGLVNGAYHLLMSSECVSRFVLGMLFRDFLGVQKFYYSGGCPFVVEPRVQPSGLEGWVNGVRGVEYVKGYGGQEARAVGILGLPRYAGWTEADKEAHVAANGELGTVTPVPVEKWPKAALVWGHDEEVGSHKYWTLTTPRQELLEMVGDLRAKGKEERLHVEELCWKILEAVPRKNRSLAIAALLAKRDAAVKLLEEPAQ